MSSTFGALETAKSGLSVAMQNMNITGHNISNANTDGYTRQRLVTSAIDPPASSYLISQSSSTQVGRGVEVLEVEQLRSAYLDNQYRALNSDYSYSDSRSQALTYLEGLFNETDEDSGMTTAIENFYSALNTFSQNTSNETYRTNVQQQAVSMTENFNIVYGEMNDLWNDQNGGIDTAAQEINSDASKLVEYNKAISQYERLGENANDLRDERNLLLDKMSALVNITYSTNKDNPSMVDVQIGGLSLVSGVTSNPIEIDSASNHTAEIDTLTSQIASVNSGISQAVSAGEPTDGLKTELSGYLDELGHYISISTTADSNGITDVSFHGASLVSGSASASIENAAAGNLTAWVELKRNNLTLDGDNLSISSGTVTSGELYAHMEMIEGSGSNNSGIPYYMSQLNSLAQEIAKNINAIHSTGYTYPYNGGQSITGVNFFDVPMDSDGAGGLTPDYSRINAGNFSLSKEVSGSIYNIAGSSEEVSLSGNPTETGNNTVALQLFQDLNNGGYYGMLDNIVGHLAITSKESQSAQDTKQSLLKNIDAQRTSLSGVSIDEETVNLITFKQSYNACARMISAIDEMMDTLIGNTGVVGR
jgi:flagellar hook-associated protein FlgK